MLKKPSPEADALIVDALKAGNRSQALRFFYQHSDGTEEEALVHLEEIEAWLRGRKTPSSMAVSLCDLVRDGKITDGEARRRMTQECPGFSQAAYDQALAQGYFESR